jgi:hypothetical protein
MFWFTKPKYHCIYSKEAFQSEGLFIFTGFRKLKEVLPLTGCAAEAELFLPPGYLCAGPQKSGSRAAKRCSFSLPWVKAPHTQQNMLVNCQKMPFLT